MRINVKIGIEKVRRSREISSTDVINEFNQCEAGFRTRFMYGRWVERQNKSVSPPEVWLGISDTCNLSCLFKKLMQKR